MNLKLSLPLRHESSRTHHCAHAAPQRRRGPCHRQVGDGRALRAQPDRPFARQRYGFIANRPRGIRKNCTAPPRRRARAARPRLCHLLRSPFPRHPRCPHSPTRNRGARPLGHRASASSPHFPLPTHPLPTLPFRGLGSLTLPFRGLGGFTLPFRGPGGLLFISPSSHRVLQR